MSPGTSFEVVELGLLPHHDLLLLLQHLQQHLLSCLAITEPEPEPEPECVAMTGTDRYDPVQAWTECQIPLQIAQQPKLPATMKTLMRPFNLFYHRCTSKPKGLRGETTGNR